MKQIINTELQKLLSIQSSEELYLLFFRLVQISTVFSTLYLLFFTFPLLMKMHAITEFEGIINPLSIFVPITFNIVQIIAIEASLRGIPRKQFWATALGLGVSALLCTSWFFLLGCFGFYCFLNGKYQRKYLKESPEPFKNFLLALNCNKIDSTS